MSKAWDEAIRQVEALGDQYARGLNERRIITRPAAPGWVAYREYDVIGPSELFPAAWGPTETDAILALYRLEREELSLTKSAPLPCKDVTTPE